MYVKGHFTTLKMHSAKVGICSEKVQTIYWIIVFKQKSCQNVKKGSAPISNSLKTSWYQLLLLAACFMTLKSQREIKRSHSRTPRVVMVELHFSHELWWASCCYCKIGYSFKPEIAKNFCTHRTTVYFAETQIKSFQYLLCTKGWLQRQLQALLSTHFSNVTILKVTIFFRLLSFIKCVFNRNF